MILEDSDTVKPNYFWIYQDIQKVFQIIANLSIQIKERSCIFGNIDQLKQSIIVKKNQNKLSKFIIISSSEQQIQLLVLLRRKQILGVVLFDLDQDNSIKPESQINEISSFDDNKIFRKYVEKCKDIKELISFFDTNDWHLSQTQFFPNFVLLTQQVQKSTIQHRVMVAMINQEAEAQIKNQMINQLICVLQKLAKFHPKLQNKQQQFSKTLNYLTKKERRGEQIIKMYTSEQSKIYLILNSFLRAMKCPTQIYYVQPLVKQIYLAVKQIQKQCFKVQVNCYRGGFMTEEEFLKLNSAVGEIAQNLGFFSISLDKQLATSFKQNVLFEIHIKGWNPEQISEQSGGFACISQFSQYYAEEEILFCPLSYFRVLQVSSKQDKIDSTEFYVKLEYKKILSEGQNQQKQQIQRQLIGLHQQMQMQISCQSSVIFRAQNKSLFNVCQIYFQFLQQKGRNLSKLICQFYPKKLIKKHGEILLECKVLENSQKQISKEDHLHYLQLAVKMGNIYMLFGKQEEAFRLLSQCKNLLAHWSTTQEQSYRYLKNYKAIFLMNIGRYKEALQLNWQAVQTAKNIYFCQSTQQFDLQSEQIEKQDNGFKRINQILRVAKQIAVKMNENKQFKQIKKRGFSNIYFTYDQYPIEYVNALVSLVDVLLALRQQQKAFHLIKQCLTILKLLYRETHPYYIYVTSKFIDTLIQLERYSSSLELSNHYLTIVQSVLGQRHLLYLSLLNKIGESLLGLKKFSEALAVFRRYQAIIVNAYDLQHPQCILSMLNIGIAWGYLGKYQQALKSLQICKTTVESTYGQRHTIYLTCLSNIGVVYFKLRRYDQALKTHQRCLSSTKSVFGQIHPDYILRLMQLIEALMALNKFEQGYGLLTQFSRKGILVGSINNKKNMYVHLVLVVLSLYLGQYQSMVAALSRLTIPHIYRFIDYSAQLSLILYKLRRFTQSLILVKAFIKHIKRQPISFLQERKIRQREIKDEKAKQKLLKKAKEEQKKHVRHPKCFLDAD